MSLPRSISLILNLMIHRLVSKKIFNMTAVRAERRTAVDKAIKAAQPKQIGALGGRSQLLEAQDVLHLFGRISPLLSIVYSGGRGM